MIMYSLSITYTVINYCLPFCHDSVEAHFVVSQKLWWPDSLQTQSYMHYHEKKIHLYINYVHENIFIAI